MHGTCFPEVLQHSKDYSHCVTAGLMSLLAAKASGATRILVNDINPANLAIAQSLGAYKTYCHARTASPESIAKELKHMTGPYGPDILIDCVGFESTMQTAVLSCASGGKIVLVGLAQDQIAVPMNTVTVRELEIVGSFAYANTVSQLRVTALCPAVLRGKDGLCRTNPVTHCACSAFIVSELSSSWSRLHLTEIHAA